MRENNMPQMITEVGPSGRASWGVKGKTQRQQTPNIHTDVQDAVKVSIPTQGSVAKAAITPRGDTDPRSPKFDATQRKRRKAHVTKEMTDCLNFLTSTVGKSETEIKNLIKDFPLKNKLLQLVDHMIATGLGGWRKDGRQLVNETGHKASLENWELTRGGHLKPVGQEQQVSFNVDKLLVIRECINE
jgi:hypothetical protein